MIIKLRPIEFSDANTLFKWRNMPEIYKLALSRSQISAKDHQAWMEKTLQNHENKKFIINVDNIDCGQIRLDHVMNNLYEISIFLLDGFKNKKIGSKVLKKILVESMKTGDIIIAKSLNNNLGSINFFKNNGFSIESYSDTYTTLKKIL